MDHDGGINETHILFDEVFQYRAILSSLIAIRIHVWKEIKQNLL
jgi:hypothetical protein